jgi:hypothetical protein
MSCRCSPTSGKVAKAQTALTLADLSPSCYGRCFMIELRRIDIDQNTAEFLDDLVKGGQA